MFRALTLRSLGGAVAIVGAVSLGALLNGCADTGERAGWALVAFAAFVAGMVWSPGR